MQKPWKVLSTAALVAALSVSMVLPAFAADGDITDTSSGTVYQAATYNSNTSAYNTLVNSIISEKAPNQFAYSFGGQQFGFDSFSTAVTNLLATPGETPAQAKTTAATTVTPIVATTIASVSAVNGTVTVTLTSAPSPAPTIASFAVSQSVNGATVTTVTPTAISMDATGKIATLTVPTVAQGTANLSVVDSVSYMSGTAATATAFTVAPLAVSTVTATDSTHVVVVMNGPVTASTVATGDFTFASLTGQTAPVLSAVTLGADKKTLYITVTTATQLVNAANGYSFNVVASSLKDAANYAVASSTIFNGIGATATAGANLVSSSYDPGTGNLTLGFNELVKTDTNFKATGITITGSGSNQSYTLTSSDYTAATTGTTANSVVITLSSAGATAVNAFTSPMTLAIAAGSVTDTLNLSNAAITATISQNLTPAVQTATFDEPSHVLTLNFNETVKASAVKPANVALVLNGVSYALSAASTVQTTSNGSQMQILVAPADLAAFPTTLTSSTVNFLAAMATDTNGNTNSAKTGLALTVNSLPSSISIASASYNSGTKQLNVAFNEYVTQSTISATTAINGITITDGTTTATLTGGAGNTVVSNTSDNNSYSFQLCAADATALAGLNFNTGTLTIKFAATTISDESGKTNASALSANMTYADYTAPTLSATATAPNSTTETVTWSKKVDPTTAQTASNYVIKSGTYQLPVTSALLLSDGKTVYLTTAAQAATTYTLVVSNVKDLAGNVVVSPQATPITFTGVAAAPNNAAPTISSLTFKDNDNSYSASAGDTLAVNFSAPVTPGTTVASDFTIGSGTFGTGATEAQGANANQILITLGTSPTAWTFLGSDMVNVSGTTGVKGTNGIAAATSATAVPSQGAVPKLVSATYADANSNGMVDANDTVTLVFNTAIQNPTALTDADFTEAAGVSLGTAPTWTQSSSTTLVVKLAGTGMAIPVNTTGKTIGTKVSANVKDVWGNATAAGGEALLVKSADTIAPAISSVQVHTAATNHLLAIGDTVKINFSKPLHLTGAAGVLTANNLNLYNGATALPYLLTTAPILSNNNMTATITIAGLHGGAGDDGWVGNTLSSSTTFNFADTGTDFADASLNYVVPSTGFGPTITFN